MNSETGYWEMQREAWLHDFETSPAIEYFDNLSVQYGGDIELIVEAPKLTLARQLDNGDGFGCAIACYRMARLAQGLKDIPQAQARELLERQGFVPGGAGGTADISERAALAMGIIDPSFIIRDSNIFNPEIKQSLQGRLWPSIMAEGIVRGYLIIMPAPMKAIYPDSSGPAEHAIIINGLRIENLDDPEKEQISLTVLDPLDRASAIPYDRFFGKAIIEPNAIFVKPQFKEGMRSRLATNINPINRDQRIKVGEPPIKITKSDRKE